MQRSSSSTAMRSGDARLTSTKPSLAKIAVVVSAEAAIMAAIVVAAAVLATNSVAGYTLRPFLRQSLRVPYRSRRLCLIAKPIALTAKENSMEKQVFAVSERV